MGLPAAVRLRSGDLARTRDRVLRRGRGTSGPLRVQVSVVEGLAPGVRVGFAVGRAVGSAVVRNAVRRRLREGVRAALADLGVPRGPDVTPSTAGADTAGGGAARQATLVLVHASPQAAGMASADLHRHLRHALGRALQAVEGDTRP